MLNPAGRQGFTLVETMVATAMTLIVCGAIYQTLTVTQRLTRAQAQQVNVQSSVRSAALVLANEFRPLAAGIGPSGGETDLASIAPTTVSYRAERGFGVLCQPGAAGRIRISRLRYSGHRDPQPGRDSASVFVEGNPESAADDAWVALVILAAGSGSCSAGEPPGIELSVSPAAVVENLPPGTPVRIHEVMELRLYRSEGRSWIGLRSVGTGENIQPLSGPVRQEGGLELEYLNASGYATGVRSEIRGIRFRVQGESEATANYGAFRGEPVLEELTGQVGLRNAP